MIVEAKHTAIALGSGDLSVLGTPAMVALMESAAMREASLLCNYGQTTVGALLNIEHTRPTAVGAEIQAEAKLINQDGRKLIFKVRAWDEKGDIGHGEHHRFIVDREKFMAKL